MSLIEKTTLVMGKHHDSFSDERLITIIIDLEKRVDDLKRIRAKSSKVERMISKLEAELIELVTLLDSRPDTLKGKDSL